MLVSRKTKSIKNPTPFNIKKYKDYKTIYRSILRKAKNNYYKDKFDEYNKNIKQTWNVLRKVLKSFNSKSDIPDQFFSGLQEISKGFNNVFVNVGQILLQLFLLQNKTLQNTYQPLLILTLYLQI